MSIKLPETDVTEDGRLDTGNLADIVYARDLFPLEKSPCPGCGLMVMRDTTFNWTLEYDEVNYTVSRQLNVLIDGRETSATANEIILVPKSNEIQFSVTGGARFAYVIYPTDW